MTTTLFLLCCATLSYTGFCRLVHTDVTTWLPVRLAVWLLTAAALANIMAVLAWGYMPQWPAALMAAAAAAIQIATCTLWLDGVPPQYQRR